MQHVFDHSRPDFESYGFTCEVWKAAPMRRPDRHNEIELNLFKSGSLTYLFGGESVTVSHGGLNAFWPAIPHRIIRHNGEPDYYVVTVPLAWFLQCRLPSKLEDRLLPGHVLDPEPVQRCFQEVLRAFTKPLSTRTPDRRLTRQPRILALRMSIGRFLGQCQEVLLNRRSQSSKGERGRRSASIP